MCGVGVGRREEASCMATGIGHHRVGRRAEASYMATGNKHAIGDQGVNRGPSKPRLLCASRNLRYPWCAILIIMFLISYFTYLGMDFGWRADTVVKHLGNSE